MSSDNLYTAQFEPEHDFPPFTGQPRIYVIASTPRSGSHMLGHVLHQTGKLGWALEIFSPRNFAEWRRRLNTSGVEDTLAELKRRRTSPNGVFGIKLHYQHVVELGGIQRVQALLPEARYVLLRRVNVLAQAVSYAKAKQTDVWFSGMQPQGEATYDYGLIEASLRRVLLDTTAWHHLLATAGLPLMDLSFEAVLRDTPGTTQRIADFLDVTLEPHELPTQPPTQRQSDPQNDAWMQRFRREYRGEPLLNGHDPFPAPTWRRVLRRLRRSLLKN
jgi:LPS sulfotransferase NodH